MEYLEYFKLGLYHILHLNGYDHILFIVVLCSIYTIKDWKKILILITAFTIGHCTTLVLSATELIYIDRAFSEFLIVLTILYTAIWNLFHKEKNDQFFKWDYLIVLFFGLIHGLGFSNFFKMLFSTLDEFIPSLLAFNIGVEIGQIVIVVSFMIIYFLLIRFTDLQLKHWTKIISVFAIGVSFYLMYNTDFIQDYLK